MSATPIRSTVFNRMQLGMETTPGVVVAATRRPAMGLRWQPNIPVNVYRPDGWRYSIESPVQKEYATADMPEQPINFSDLTYWLSSIMHVAAVAGTWVFAHDPFNPQAIQTYTIERGTGTSGEKVAYAICNSLNFRWTKEVASMSGSLFGQIMATGQTLATSGVTENTKALAIPGKNTIKIGTTVGGIAKIAQGVLEAGFNIGGVYSPNFYLDETDRNFGDVKADAPTVSANLVVKSNSAAWGYLSNLRASDKLFCQIQSFGNLGPNSGADPYELKILFPFQFDQQGFTDTNGLETNTLTMRPIYDTTQGYAFQITLVNTMATL